MLSSLADFFEKERDCLLSELRTSVIEAQSAIKDQLLSEDVPEETTAKAIEKLEELREKIKEQVKLKKY